MDRKLTQEMEERRAARLNLVRSADRSEKIRTYNYAQVSTGSRKWRGLWLNFFLQDRVTDHRIGLTLMNLTGIMEGDGLYRILEDLKKNHEEEVMEDMLNSVQA